MRIQTVLEHGGKVRKEIAHEPSVAIVVFTKSDVEAIIAKKLSRKKWNEIRDLLENGDDATDKEAIEFVKTAWEVVRGA